MNHAARAVHDEVDAVEKSRIVKSTVSTSVRAVLVQADCLDSLWFALPWYGLLGLTPTRKEQREGGIVVRRARTVPVDFEATPDSITSVNRVLGTEFVKYSGETTLVKTESR